MPSCMVVRMIQKSDVLARKTNDKIRVVYETLIITRYKVGKKYHPRHDMT